MELHRTPARWVGALGIAWVVIFLASVGGLQGEPPAMDAPLAELREFFATNGTRYLVGDFLAGASFMLLFVPFIVFLPRGLGLVESAWSRLATIGAAVLVAVGGTATSFLDAVAVAKGSPAIDDGALTALLLANGAGIALIGLPAALVTFSIATMLRTPGLWGTPDRAGGLARVAVALAWIATPLLVVGAAFPIADDPNGLLWTIRFASFVGLALVVLITGILILSHRPPVPAVTQR
jgi:hypothetical protein